MKSVNFTFSKQLAELWLQYKTEYLYIRAVHLFSILDTTLYNILDSIYFILGYDIESNWWSYVIEK